MIEKMVFLASEGIQGLFAQWEQVGMFQYILPFVIIFGITFGILSRLKLFGDDASKGVNIIVSIAVGLLALQSDFVSSFFTELFPRLGIGLVILLVAMIILGLFLQKGSGGIMLIVAIIVIIVILGQTFASFGWIQGSLGDIISDYLGWILAIIGIAVIIGWRPQQGKSSPFQHSLGAAGAD